MTRTIRALSYNFFLRPPFVHNRKGDLKEARLDYFVKNVLSKYDIFVFQELFTFMNTRPYRLVQAFYKHHLSKVPTTPSSSTSTSSSSNTQQQHHDPHYGLVVFPKHLKQKEKSIQYHANGVGTNLRRLQIFDSGLCILSRYPIAATDYMIYKAGTAIDSWASKGALSALIEVEEDVYIHIVTTHVQADYNDGKTIYYKKQLEQIAELRQFMEKKSKDHANLNVLGTFLMADLNIDARSDFKVTNEMIFKTSAAACDDNKIPPTIDTRVFEGGKKYKDMMNILNGGSLLQFDNVLRNMQGHHPITFGDIVYQYDEQKKQYVVKPKETTFIGRYCEACQECIDYSFFVPPPTHQQSKAAAAAAASRNKLKIEGASVVTLETPGHAFPQLSDHYALETLFSIDGAREMEQEVIITSEQEGRLVKEIEPIYSPSEVAAPEPEDYESPSTMPASPASTIGSRFNKASALLTPEEIPFQIAKLKHRIQQKKNRVIQDLQEKKLIRFPAKGYIHTLLTSPLLMLFLLVSISVFTGMVILPMMKSKPANK